MVEYTSATLAVIIGVKIFLLILTFVASAEKCYEAVAILFALSLGITCWYLFELNSEIPENCIVNTNAVVSVIDRKAIIVVDGEVIDLNNISKEQYSDGEVIEYNRYLPYWSNGFYWSTGSKDIEVLGVKSENNSK